MPDATQGHWDRVYAGATPEAASWFQRQPAPSLQMIATTGLGPDATVIDVGGGSSSLVDHLLDRGFRRITVLDVSAQAVAAAKSRLGPRAGAIDWQIADITAWAPPTAAYDLWHDRAAFHFLVREKDRQAYLRALNRALRTRGYVILATFALTGPARCSGLPVQRYSADTLAHALGAGFQLIDVNSETHVTPGGAPQDFSWCLFRKSAA